MGASWNFSCSLSIVSFFGTLMVLFFLSVPAYRDVVGTINDPTLKAAAAMKRTSCREMTEAAGVKCAAGFASGHIIMDGRTTDLKLGTTLKPRI